jgi:hypothetical protein
MEITDEETIKKMQEAMKHDNLTGPVIKLSQLMEIVENQIRRELNTRHYKYVSYGREMIFSRVRDKVVVSIQAEIFYWYMWSEIHEFQYEIEHDPHMIVLPVEID